MKPASLAALVMLLTAPAFAADEAPAKTDPREPLKPFNDLVGEWRGTGEPEGTREEKRLGFWTEKLNLDWQFKGDDVWIRIAINKGKHFQKAELRAVPGKKSFQLKAVTVGGETQTYEGTLEDRRLTLDRSDDKTKETHRLVFSFLHSNRFLYRFEVKKPERDSFAKLWQVGATKEGVPFAGPSDSSPECIVSGGKGTMAVTHKGKTYYVCCSGCRDEFRDNPEKYIKEFEEKIKSKEKGK